MGHIINRKDNLNELKRFIVDDDGYTIAVLLCKKERGHLKFGFHYCGKNNTFVESIGIKNARIQYEWIKIILPHEANINDILDFTYKAVRYFKNTICFQDIRIGE